MRETRCELRTAAAWALASMSGLNLGHDAEAWDAWQRTLDVDAQPVVPDGESGGAAAAK